LAKIVDVRGCFWHQHRCCIDSHIPKSRTEYWTPKLNRNKKRDAQNLAKLRKLGWDVLVVWECAVKDIGGLAKRLQDFLSG
jgi:DNA mismatch endonuclease (patch repair protein)